MIIEYLRYTIDSSQAGAFVAAWKQAREPMRQSGHMISFEVSQAIQLPTNWIVRIEWDSAPGREAFRRGRHYAQFSAALDGFNTCLSESGHYDRVVELGAVMALSA